MVKRNLIILIIYMIIQWNAFAQQVDSTNHYSISAKYGYGFVYEHHKSFAYIIQDYPQTFEINLNKRTNGTKTWHQIYKFPTVGFGYEHSTLGNNQILGKANALLCFISVPIIENKILKFSYKCATGTAWLPKKFDLYNNIYNIVIGTHLNAYLNLNLDLDIKVIDKIHFLLGGGLSHYSNGGLQQPNKGVNIFSIQTGLLYKLNDEKLNYHFDSLPKFKKVNELSIIFTIGFKGLEPARTHKYMVSTFSLNGERQLSYKSRLGIGLDLFKDNSREEYLKDKEGVENPVTKDLFYAGSHFSYDLVFGKTSFTIQMGAYIWQKAKSYQSTYNRFGIKYRFSDHFIANITLKTFWASADFAEWGIGYRF